MKYLTLASCLVVVAMAAPGEFLLNSNAMIDHINNITRSWKAGPNFHPWINREFFEKLMGVRDIYKEALALHRTLPLKRHDPTLRALPQNFDARSYWPKCHSIGEIRDQGNCNSDWALAAVESMTDRICIQSNEQQHFRISAEDLLTCCLLCGDGCDGGFPSAAWRYYEQKGLVTGGPYDSKLGCRPYSVRACDHYVQGHHMPCTGGAQTPTCDKRCRASYSSTYEQDLHFGASSYSVKGVDQIMQEIYTKGPVEATFDLKADFLTYKSGVYSHTTDVTLRSHAVKILGWGVENGEEYWLAANSWNQDWGDKGFFKILRGQNECGIESGIYAGDPKLT